MKSEAEIIAGRILDIVESDLTIEDISARTKLLWDVAKELGLDAEVDEMLQAISEREMEEALERLGISNGDQAR